MLLTKNGRDGIQEGKVSNVKILAYIRKIKGIQLGFIKAVIGEIDNGSWKIFLIIIGNQNIWGRF